MSMVDGASSSVTVTDARVTVIRIHYKGSIDNVHSFLSPCNPTT